MSTINFTQPETCSICLDSYAINETKARIHSTSPITHNFHETCIRTHVASGIQKFQCPLCLRPLQNVTFWKKNEEGSDAQVERAPLIRRVDEEFNTQFVKHAFRALCVGLTIMFIKALQDG
jgi:hypothetical protein